MKESEAENLIERGLSAGRPREMFTAFMMAGSRAAANWGVEGSGKSVATPTKACFSKSNGVPSWRFRSLSETGGSPAFFSFFSSGCC